MNPHSPVRVEIDSAGAVQAPTPLPDDSGGPSNSLVIVAVGLVIAAVVLALFALRPSNGETAAGTQRQPSTTTQPTTTEPVDDPEDVLATATTDPESPAETNAPTFDRTLAFEPQSDGIVRTSDGFLGLGWSVPNDGLPVMFTSDDAETWTPIDTETPNFNGPGATSAGRTISYRSLIATEDGFAMLRTITKNVPGSRIPEEVEFQRVISPDGIRWTNDPDFQFRQSVARSSPPCTHPTPSP